MNIFHAGLSGGRASLCRNPNSPEQMEWLAQNQPRSGVRIKPTAQRRGSKVGREQAPEERKNSCDTVSPVLTEFFRQLSDHGPISVVDFQRLEYLGQV
jgi:hypothetical protein